MILADDKKKVASVIIKKIHGQPDFDEMREENEEYMDNQKLEAPTKEALDVNGATDTLKIALERQDSDAVLSSLKSILSLMMRKR